MPAQAYSSQYCVAYPQCTDKEGVAGREGGAETCQQTGLMKIHLYYHNRTRAQIVTKRTVVVVAFCDNNF